MNIYLIPHNWARHVAPALLTSGAVLLVWWVMLFAAVPLGPTLFKFGFLWSQGMEGVLFLGVSAGTLAFMSVLIEGSLRRRAPIQRVVLAAVGGVLAFVFAAIFILICQGLTIALSSEVMRPVAADPSLVALRYKGVLWGAAGVAAGLGPYCIRRAGEIIATVKAKRAMLQDKMGDKMGKLGGDKMKKLDGQDEMLAMLPGPASRGGNFFSHVFGSLGAASLGAAVWDGVGYYGVFSQWDFIQPDMYMASALGVFVWGIFYGLLVWGIPKDMYAGWIRVLSRYRYGHRIPVDRINGQPSERFVGHFPRGLDLYLPATEGVAELHTSFVVDGNGRYAVRGLSVQPTVAKRFLEAVKIHYNVLRPAPLETELNTEDRVIMSDGANESVVEFILLPKEER